MDMKRAWRNAKRRADRDGGSSRDYIGDEMKKEWAIAKIMEDKEQRFIVSPHVNLRMDDMTRQLVDEMMDDGSYKNVSDLLRQSVHLAYASRHLACHSEKQDE